MTRSATFYFVAKCRDLLSLKKCINTGIWACQNRVIPPHPTELLQDAFTTGNVIVIFSVNNQHGWHGYCQMTSSPSSEAKTTGEEAGGLHQNQVVGIDEEARNAKQFSTAVEDVVKTEQQLGFADYFVQLKDNIIPDEHASDKVVLKMTEPGNLEDGGEKDTLRKDYYSRLGDLFQKSLDSETDSIYPHENSGLEKSTGEILVSLDSETTNTHLHQDSKKVKPSPQVWQYFKVRWLKEFLSCYGEQCLNYVETRHLLLPNKEPVNKSRNWQRLSETAGKELCGLIDQEIERLAARKLEAEQQRQSQLAPSFFQENCGELGNANTLWREAVKKVKRELGTVHLACPFGSQRYNMATADSDVDMFIVYQAKTRDVLSFNPPKQTLKNSRAEVNDYTVLELLRYCELLVAGDPRCVETLFMADNTVLTASSQWRDLQQLGPSLLSRWCLDKYLHDAHGSRGTKQLLRWRQDFPKSEQLSSKMSKLVYIILRLLQNARDIVYCQPLTIYRQEGSTDHRLLVAARQGHLTYTEAWSEIQRLQGEIDQKKDQVANNEDSKVKVENWLLGQRYLDFTLYPTERVT